jgi:Fur family transcriptional regulator, peroxide stress response regulator
METILNPVDEVIERLRAQGMRVTPQRVAVLKILIDNDEHLSAEDIYARVQTDYPMMGLATIYKTISMLKEMGEITELNIDNSSARFDGSRKPPHPHFVCSQCNTIIDLDENLLADIPKNVSQQTGYQITNYRLDFFGLCPNCQL